MESHSSSSECYYEICLQGRLGLVSKEWFPGLKVTTIVNEENTITQLSGFVADQSVLLGILTRAIDLNMPILSVRRTHLEENILDPIESRPIKY